MGDGDASPSPRPVVARTTSEDTETRLPKACVNILAAELDLAATLAIYVTALLLPSALPKTLWIGFPARYKKGASVGKGCQQVGSIS